MAYSSTVLDIPTPDLQSNPEGFIVKHFLDRGVSVQAWQRIEKGTFLIRLQTGHMQYVDVEYNAETIRNMDYPTLATMLDNLIIQHTGNVNATIKTPEDLAKELEKLEQPKKRVRMGKWGIKKEMIRG